MLEEFEPFKGFVKVVSNELIGISATIAHWYDIRPVILYPPVPSRVMSLKFQKFFCFLLIPFFLLGFNFDWIASLKLQKGKKATLVQFGKKKEN